MAETTIIKWADIPGFLPSGFTDRILLNVRPIKQGVYTPFKILTENPEAVVFDSLKVQRLIQAANYDRYTLEFIGNEGLNIGMLEFANDIQVISLNKTYYAKIISITSDNVFNTPSKRHIIEFYDTNAYNYPNGIPIISPMRSDVITSWKALTELSKVKLTVSSTDYSYYTGFSIKKLPSEIENQKNMEISGVKKVTRLTAKTKKQVVFYMTDSKAAEFSKLAPQCTTDTSFSVTEGIYTLYIPEIEQPAVTVEPVAGGIDLNKVTFNFTEVITDINPL